MKKWTYWIATCSLVACILLGGLSLLPEGPATSTVKVFLGLLAAWLMSATLEEPAPTRPPRS